MPSMTVCIDSDLWRRGPSLPGPSPDQPLILVVEDDSSIRDFVCRLLRNATNAFVMAASDPYAAVSMMRSIARWPDLLIADIDLSADQNGIDLARELSANDPSIRVLLMSAGNLPPADIPSGWRFLEKPFPIADLLDCVNELCGTSAALASGPPHHLSKNHTNA